MANAQLVEGQNLNFVVPAYRITALKEKKRLDPRTLAQAGLKMAVISKDGKRIGEKFVQYVIVRINNEWEVFWDEANFSAVDYGGNKKTGLDLRHYSTQSGDIKNVKVTDDFASFDIDPSLVGKIKIHVICRPPKEHLVTPTVQAIAIYPDHTEKWIIIEKIILPSTEIFGNPLPGE